jgi:hypothetical protein
MTVEALDLPLRLPRRHFFYTSLYSPPRPGIILLTVPRVSVLIRSPSLTHCFQSFCDHSLPLSCCVVFAVGLQRGAAEFVFAYELVLILFLEFQLLRRALREGSYIVKDECSSAALEL